MLMLMCLCFDYVKSKIYQIIKIIIMVKNLSTHWKYSRLIHRQLMHRLHSYVGSRLPIQLKHA